MSEVVMRDVADKFKLQRMHAVIVMVCRRPDSNRLWLTPTLKATDLDHSATTLRQNYYVLFANIRSNCYTTNTASDLSEDSQLLCVNFHDNFIKLNFTNI